VLLALTAGLFDRVPLDRMTDAEHALREIAAMIAKDVRDRLNMAESPSDEDCEAIFGRQERGRSRPGSSHVPLRLAPGSNSASASRDEDLG